MRSAVLAVLPLPLPIIAMLALILPTAAQTAAAPRVPIHTAADDNGVPYGTWAAGTSYKVSFEDDMTFVPYLGGCYPTNRPWSWRTTSLTVGGVELLRTGERPTRTCDDYRCEYRFGAFVEAYDVLAEGLEQSFVVAKRPAAGPLVVRGRVTTDLVAAATGPAHVALDFADPAGRQVLTYGRAFAFDARGLRTPVETAFADGEITLTVPAAFMANAILPVTVDPLTASRVLIHLLPNQTSVAGDADTARQPNAPAHNLLASFAVAASATDLDVYTYLMDDDAQNGILVHTDLTANWSTDEVASAFVGTPQRFAVMLRRVFGGGNPALRCHVHAAQDLSLSTAVIPLQPPAGFGDWRVDIGGALTGSAALVVFQRDAFSGTFGNSGSSDVLGVELDLSTAGGAFGTPFQIEGGSFSDNEWPSINKVGDDSDQPWLCVYQSEAVLNQSDPWAANGRLVRRDGTMASGQWTSDLAQNGTMHQLRPTVEGRQGRYAVAFSTASWPANPFPTTSTLGDRLFVERLDWSGSSASPTLDLPPVQFRATSSRRMDLRDIAYDSNTRSHWTAVFRVLDDPSPGFHLLRYARFGLSGAETEAPAPSLVSVPSQNGNELAAGCVFNPESEIVAIAVLFSNTGVVIRAVNNPAVPWSTNGSSCGPPNIHWDGSQQIGSEFSRPQVTGATPTSWHFLLVGLATTDLPVIDPAVAPGCRLLVPASGSGALGTFPLAIGANPSWAFPLPEWLTNTTFYFQDWFYDGTSFRSTQRLEVPIVK
ncbi:MAG: hypothetical protein KDE27_01650 [Planctomycetes bacterium]|nr:hypothetical protein [Planctomycetota bacterium]